MSLDPARLLAGPRGRRLLLEFAVRSEALASADVTTELPLWKSLFDHHLAPPSRVPVAGWGEDFVPRPTSPDELAQRLASVPLVRARPTLLLDALQRSVATSSAGGAALPFDAIDQLLANWRVDPCLGRVARQLVATGKVSWWAKALRRDGQLVAEPPRHKGRKSAPWPAGSAKVAKALVRQARDAAPGQSSSTPPGELLVSSRAWPRRGPLVALFGAEPPARVTPMAVPRSTRVLELDGEAAWLDLCRRHPRDVTASHGQAWSAAGGGAATWLAPDWRRVARHHDVVHLPVASWLSLADRPLEVEPGTSTLVAGWLPGAAVWLRAPG